MQGFASRYAGEPLLNREQTWNTFFEEVNKHCDNRDNGDRSFHRFLVYALAPGTGKTTMLVESGQEFARRQAAGLLSANFPSRRLDIFTTFNFTTAAEAFDHAHPQFALAWRMLDAVFGTSVYDGSCDAPLREALPRQNRQVWRRRAARYQPVHRRVSQDARRRIYTSAATGALVCNDQGSGQTVVRAAREAAADCHHGWHDCRRPGRRCARGFPFSLECFVSSPFVLNSCHWLGT